MDRCQSGLMLAIMIFATAFAVMLVASVGVDPLTRARVQWQTGSLQFER